jgi:hypothetical protein
MDISSTAIKIIFIGFVVFGALSLFHIVRLSTFLYKGEKQPLTKKEWASKLIVPLIIYCLFIFFGVLSMILVGL